MDSGPAYMQNDEGTRGKRLRRNSLIIDHQDLMQKLKMIEEVRHKKLDNCISQVISLASVQIYSWLVTISVILSSVISNKYFIYS